MDAKYGNAAVPAVGGRFVRRGSPDRAVAADRKVSLASRRRGSFGRDVCTVRRPSHNGWRATAGTAALLLSLAVTASAETNKSTLSAVLEWKTNTTEMSAWLVNDTQEPQLYKGGLGMRSSRYGCSLTLTDPDGKQWSADAPPLPEHEHYNDIIVPPGGKVLIGRWNLTALRYSAGELARAGAKTTFAELPKPVRWQVQWWDGVFQLGPPLRSPLVEVALSPVGVMLATTVWAADKDVVPVTRAENGKTIRAVVGQTVEVCLPTGEWAAETVNGEVLGFAGKRLEPFGYPQPNPPSDAATATTAKPLHTAVFAYRALKPGRADLRMKHILRTGLRIRHLSDGEAFAVTVEVLLPPDGKAAERTTQLNENLDQFRLSLWGAGAWDGKHVNLTLTVPADAPADHSPLEGAGPQWENETRTVVRLSKEQAAKIIDHLAAEGFLGRADLVGRIDRRLAGPAVTFNVYYGTGPQRYFELIGWRPELLQRLDALRQVLDGDAGRALDDLLKAFAPLRPQWQPRGSNTFVDGGATWQVRASNALAMAAVERVLYERADDPHFYIRVRITNTTDRPLGADLRDYWRVIYPNQWGVSQQDRRGEINERRLKPVADKSALVPDFAAGRLTRIEPGASVDYYREFNAGGRKEVEEQARQFAGKYLVVSLDGQVPVTDGKRIEALSCLWEGGRTAADTDLVIPLPVKWAAMPANASIISEPVNAAARAARALAPFFRNGWYGWPVGTETRTTFLDDKVDGWYSYVQPDLVYRLTETALTRTQVVDGKPVVQQFDPANEAGWQPAYLHKLPTAKTTPTTIEIDGVKIDCLLYESTMDDIGRDVGGTTVLKEWVLADQPTIWLRTEVNQNYKVIKSLRAMKRVGDRQVACVVVEERMQMSGGHQVSTTWLSPAVPGHVVEKLSQTWLEGRQQRSHERVVEIRLPATGKSTP